VRDGKDEISDRESLKNKISWFKKIDKRVNLRTSIRYNKNIGFQFKCFADYKEIDFERLKKVQVKLRELGLFTLTIQPVKQLTESKIISFIPNNK